MLNLAVEIILGVNWHIEKSLNSPPTIILPIKGNKYIFEKERKKPSHETREKEGNRGIKTARRKKKYKNDRIMPLQNNNK